MLTEQVSELRRFGYLPNSFIADDEVAVAVLNFIEKGLDGKSCLLYTSAAGIQTGNPRCTSAA